MGFAKQKLKTNLRLAINRLKLLEKKKTELAQKARREIADYLGNGKDERARIRVEHIIREDYLVEALELLELYCDLLLARFGLIETMTYCDEGMIESVTSLIWVAPRLQTDVQEFKVIAEQLGYKFGKTFAHEAATNSNDTVNPRLILKLSPKPPPKILVERYLIEIARSHNVQFEPDPLVMLGDDIPDPSDFKGGGGSGGGGGIGFEGYGSNLAGSATMNNFPSVPGMAGGNPAMAYPPPPHAGGSLPYPPGGPPSGGPGDQYPMDKNTQPASMPPAYPGDDLPRKEQPGPPTSGQQSAPPPSAPPPTFPDLPPVPTNSLPSGGLGNSAGGEDVDFDDLTRRFEELKKRK
ncbi:IST1 homolog isoform X2 [Nematostella vectensis]|uniref:IST1 homolog isoform X2 n=1 Tax=Nematostella vectensis TaxID=45351 RepID=UPI0020776B9F|nr:IST1 homolog isoform X2 [Nematostella vectensis]